MILSLYSIIDKDKEETKEILKMSIIFWTFALISTLMLFGFVFFKAIKVI